MEQVKQTEPTYPLFCVDLRARDDERRYLGPFDTEAEASSYAAVHEGSIVRRCRRVLASEVARDDLAELVSEYLSEALHSGEHPYGAWYDWDSVCVSLDAAFKLDAFVCEGDDDGDVITSKQFLRVARGREGGGVSTKRGKLLGLAGAAGSGKTSVAQAIIDAGLAQRVRFAGPLKDALVTMGLSRAQVDGDLKEVPVDLLCGHTPRHAMQTLGTQWGRELIGADVWVRFAMARVDALLAEGKNVVIDDVRFDNEAAAILERDGSLVTLVRGERPPKPTSLLGLARAYLRRRRKQVHASERGLTVPTMTIRNDGPLDETVEDVLAWWEVG